MNNARIIILWIIIFLILVLYPVWDFIRSGEKTLLQLDVPAGHKECVMPVDYMKENHMKLLIKWRDSVVRNGDRSPATIKTVKYEKSLSQTCLKCHDNKKAFCDRCHGYLSVAPSCWDCHYFSKEKKSALK